MSSIRGVISAYVLVNRCQMIDVVLLSYCNRSEWADGGVRLRALSIGRYSVMICPTYLPSSTSQTATLPADTLVFVSLNRSNPDLYYALNGKVPALRIVGDANTARHLPVAVREGHLTRAAV